MAAQPTFPLYVHDDERALLRTALAAYRSDFGHDEQHIVAVADDVLARIPADEATALELDAAQLKITWSALHGLLQDTQRDQDAERRHLRDLLGRLPDERDVRAIDLDAELGRR